MTTRIGFRPFLNKYSNGHDVEMLVDANVLIAFHDKNHEQSDSIRKFLIEISKKYQCTFYSTVTTKSEFLDYMRRMYLTKGINSIFKSDYKLNAQTYSDVMNLKKRIGKRVKDENTRAEKQDDVFDTSKNYAVDKLRLPL